MTNDIMSMILMGRTMRKDERRKSYRLVEIEEYVEDDPSTVKPILRRKGIKFSEWLKGAGTVRIIKARLSGELIRKLRDKGFDIEVK